MSKIRLAKPGDEAALRAFLRPHLDSSMFLLGNLAAHGLGFGPHPHATRFALLEQAGGITGVLAATRGGYLMCQLPGKTIDQAPALLAALGRQPFTGMTGLDGQVLAVLAALGLPEAAFARNAAEPLMRMDLADLPDPGVVLTPAGPAHRALLQGWLTGMLVETGQAGADRAETLAAERVELAIDGRVQLLGDAAGQPVAMAAIGARAEGAVQVSGVYVAPEHRRQGHAGTVTAALLAAERKAGTRLATLFANNPTARRVYLRLGFQVIGAYRLAMLHQPVTLNA